MSSDKSEPIPHEPLSYVVTLPLDELPAPKSVQISSDNILKTAQNVLSLVVSTVAVLTASGFIIVNSFLAKFTIIGGYSILPSQYIAAGIGMWVVVLLLIGGIGSVGSLIISLVRRLPRSHNHSTKRTEKSRRPPSLAVICAFPALGLLHCWRGIYLRCAYLCTHPEILGGGIPDAIAVAFNDSKDIQELGCSPIHENSSISEVSLLAELNDGLLVLCSNLLAYVPPHGVVLKNNLIKGIIDLRGPSAGGTSVIYQLDATEIVPEPTREATASP